MNSIEREQVRAFRRVLRRFERVHRVLMMDQDCCCGLTTTQCHPLLEIDEMKETGLADLAARLNIDSSALSRTVEGLVQSGLVDRRPDSRDRRRVVLSLTAKGQRVCDDINAKNDRLYNDVLSHPDIGPRERTVRAFDRLVLTLEAAVDRSDRCCGKDS